jgi:hypothetical protein
MLDPQLERDTVAIGDLPGSRVLLMNDASLDIRLRMQVP